MAGVEKGGFRECFNLHSAFFVPLNHISSEVLGRIGGNHAVTQLLWNKVHTSKSEAHLKSGLAHDVSRQSIKLLLLGRIQNIRYWKIAVQGIGTPCRREYQQSELILTAITGLKLMRYPHQWADIHCSDGCAKVN